MALELTWSDTGVEIHVEGDFPNQMVALNKALTRDPRSRTIRSMLINTLDADSFYADAGLVQAIAEMDISAYANGPYMRVAVVTTNAKMLEIVTMYASHFKSLNPDGADYQVFPDCESARIWLDSDRKG